MDKDRYDRPEDDSTLFGRGLVLVICALVVVGLLYVIVHFGYGGI